MPSRERSGSAARMALLTATNPGPSAYARMIRSASAAGTRDGSPTTPASA